MDENSAKGRMEDTEDEIDFANLIDMFDSSFYDEDDSDNEIITLPKVQMPKHKYCNQSSLLLFTKSISDII